MQSHCFVLIVTWFCSSLRMENDKKAELASFLKVIPPVEFCCVYGSSLHPNNKDKVSVCSFYFSHCIFSFYF